MKKRSCIIITAAAIALLLLAVGLPCQIRLIFGIPCPTCGMTRSYISLIKGDLYAAFRYHPLFWLLPAFAVFYAAVKKTRIRRTAAVAVLALYLLVYIIRMLTLFPCTPPMDFNRNALIIKLIERISVK